MKIIFKDKSSEKKTSFTPINWFPGHMAKTKKQLKENLALVDIVAEMIDARAPVSSRDPGIDSIILKKPRFIVLSKSDLADPLQTDRWQKYYESLGIPSIKLDCLRNGAIPKFIKICKDILKEKIEKWNSKGMFGRNIKAVVVGVPNVGKSTLINNLTQKKRAKVENKPGVTRENQWFSINNGLELLDTPGVLSPRFENQYFARNLAFIGAIKDSVLNCEEVALDLVKILIRKYPEDFAKRFGVDLPSNENLNLGYIFESIGKKKGALLPEGKVDFEKISKNLINEFRSGKIGRITLESVDDISER